MQILKGQKATVNVHKTKKKKENNKKKLLKNPVLLRIRKSQEPEVLDVPVLDF